MVDYKQDLWPDEIEYSTIVSPLTIIKEQGKILGRKTNNIVVGEVKTINNADVPFAYKFVLVCSTINYEYNLFGFGFPIEMYPVTIIPDASIANELDLLTREQRIIIHSEQECMETLRKIFSARKTVTIINALKSQSQDIKD